MRCDRFREAASARLDGEPIGMSVAAIEHHLASCVDCAGWEEEAIRLTRQARVATVEVPDLVDSITAEIALPAARVRSRRLALRAALFIAGAVQLAIAIPALAGTSIGMQMSPHATHEAAAWNLALAAAFLATASRPRRAAGLIPLLATFIVALGTLSVHDYASGVVTVDRLSMHVDAVAGLLLVLLLDRTERARPPDRAWTADGGGATGAAGGRSRLRGAA